MISKWNNTPQKAYDVIHRAVGIDVMVDVGVDFIPDGLQCSDVFILSDDPWFGACAKPLLIGSDKFLPPVIVVQSTFREVRVGVL